MYSSAESGYKRTTELVVLRKSSLPLIVHNSIIAVNAYKNSFNNGVLFLDPGKILKFNDCKNIYLASIGGNELGVPSTILTLEKNATASISGETVQLIGAIELNNSKLDLKLSGENSFWYGSVQNKGNNEFNFTLENGATWIYNINGMGLFGPIIGYDIQNITLNNGTIILADDLIADIYKNTKVEKTDLYLSDSSLHYIKTKHQKLEIGNLSGTGGLFKIDLDWSSNQGKKNETTKSDFIYITNVEGSGSVQRIWFDTEKAHLDEMPLNEKLYFASVGTGETTFTVDLDSVSYADEVYAFDFSTESEKESGKDSTYWYLTKTLGTQNENVSLLDNASLASYALVTELERFNDRHLEAQHADRGATGLWVRNRYGTNDMKNAVSIDKNMIQVGYDFDVSSADSRKFVGLAFDYTSADTKLDQIGASGDQERYGFNLYYTVLADCGGYLDLNAKFGRLSSDFTGKNALGQGIDISYWQSYFGVSAEAGYRFNLSPNIFVEPQAQLQLLRLRGNEFTSEGGVHETIGSLNSLIGRVGVRAGYQFTSGEVNQGSVFVFADLLNEFNGDRTLTAEGKTTRWESTVSGDQTWYDFGIGADVALWKNVRLWTDAKYISGSDFDNNWQVNAGIRCTF